jgi:hypothetical protein
MPGDQRPTIELTTRSLQDILKYGRERGRISVSPSKKGRRYGARSPASELSVLKRAGNAMNYNLPARPLSAEATRLYASTQVVETRVGEFKYRLRREQHTIPHILCALAWFLRSYSRSNGGVPSSHKVQSSTWYSFTQRGPRHRNCRNDRSARRPPSGRARGLTHTRRPNDVRPPRPQVHGHSQVPGHTDAPPGGAPPPRAPPVPRPTMRARPRAPRVRSRGGPHTWPPHA